MSISIYNVVEGKFQLSLCTDVPPPSEKNLREWGTSVHRLVPTWIKVFLKVVSSE